eukprot:5627074-Prymnesium_polylepis.1
MCVAAPAAETPGDATTVPASAQWECWRRRRKVAAEGATLKCRTGLATSQPSCRPSAQDPAALAAAGRGGAAGAVAVGVAELGSSGAVTVGVAASSETRPFVAAVALTARTAGSWASSDRLTHNCGPR